MHRPRTAAVASLLLALATISCGGAARPTTPLSSPSAARGGSVQVPAGVRSLASTMPPSTGPPAPLAAAPPLPTARPHATLAAPLCTTPSRLAQWSNQRLAWQVVAVPVEASSLGTAGSEIASGAGGILLFGDTAPADLAAGLARLESTAPNGIAPLVMSDVEGGAVERAANLLGPMPSARQLGQTMSPAQIETYAVGAGRRMRAIGLTMDLAPVMDLDAGSGPSTLNPDGTRSFSANPVIAAADSSAFAAGLSAAGVVPVGKHFPGLHGARDNTDLRAAQTAPWPLLQHEGLEPFATAIDRGLPAVMLSNASVPGLSALPSSISPEVVAALRGQLGFRGLIVTDSLTAGAIMATGLTVAQAATSALIAGADMVLWDGAGRDVTGDARSTATAISAAVASGRLARSQLVASVVRVLAAKHVDVCATP